MFPISFCIFWCVWLMASPSRLVRWQVKGRRLGTKPISLLSDLGGQNRGQIWTQQPKLHIGTSLWSCDFNLNFLVPNQCPFNLLPDQTKYARKTHQEMQNEMGNMTMALVLISITSVMNYNHNSLSTEELTILNFERPPIGWFWEESI